MNLNTLYKHLSKTEECRKLEEVELSTLDYQFSEGGVIWEVSSEITYNGSYLELILYLDFPPEFPNLEPKVFIQKEVYEEIKYIPHINQDCSICIFDSGLNTIIPRDNHEDFLDYMIYRSKRIVQAGENLEYITKEFKKEFRAYWELDYSKKDEIYNIGVHSIGNGENELKAFRCFTNLLGKYHYYLYDNEADFYRIMKLAKSKGCVTKEMKVHLIDNPFGNPPYEMTYSQSLELIKTNKAIYEQLKKSCKTNSIEEILIVFQNKDVNPVELFGWTYKSVDFPTRKRGGPRSKPSNFDILSKSITGNSKMVTRLSFDNLSSNRLMTRTTGYPEKESSVLLSGLGSVGSNLLFFLKNLPINKFGLVDPQQLASENIMRSLLGFEYTGQSKSQILSDFLISSNPLVDVEFRNESITKIIRNELDFINSYNFHLVAIGKTMIEEFILTNLENGKLKRPTILFWVEPFLASGQVLFIDPKDAKSAKTLLKEFRYSVLSRNENKMDSVYFVEGSCQSGYFPYSSSLLTQFLAAIFPFLKNAIINGINSSKVLTWVGDKELLKDQELVLSDFGTKHESYTLIENSIC